MMNQQCLPKSVLMPLGPGALSKGRDLTIESISSFVKGVTKTVKSGGAANCEARS
jgi:hypothetical protein